MIGSGLRLTNFTANALGRFWSVLSNYLFIPIYIKLLGIESYSIISFSLVLAGLMAVIDAGITATLTREVASARSTSSEKLRMLQTLETCYVIVVILVIGIFMLLADGMASRWLRLQEIGSAEVSISLRVVGVGIALQMMANFYLGGLFGLDRHVTANAYQVAWGMARNALVVLPLLVWPSLLVFFAWQGIATLAYLVAVRHRTVALLVAPTRPSVKFQIDPMIVRRVWRFAGGMLVVSLVAATNTQLDRLVMSRMLSVVELGYYTVAVALAQGLLTVVSPISVTILPRLTQLYSVQDDESAAVLYRQALTITGIAVGSLAITLALHGRALLWVWTGDETLAFNTAAVVPYVTIGTALLAFQVIPFMVAIANGYTRLNVFMSLVAVVITIPAYIIAIGRAGMIGAATVWMVLHVVATPVYFALIHLRYFRRRIGLTDYARRLLLPGAIAVAGNVLLSTPASAGLGRIVLLVWIGSVTLVVLGVNGMVLLPASLRSRVLLAGAAGGARAA